MVKQALAVTPSLEEMATVFKEMRAYFDDGVTLPLSVRKKCLSHLLKVIERDTELICEAAYKDFKKPRAEMLLTEVYTVIGDLNHTISKLNKWAKPSRYATNMLLKPSRSAVHKSPKGIVCVFAPWNYPFYLSMMPLISAIAAGNVVVLKPANETSHVAQVIKNIVEEVFDSRHVFTIQGEGRNVGELLLLNFEFNHIFFTGSAQVGKWIMAQAAAHLTPVTLELGGKSPAIIERGYNLDLAAKRIVWGKFINAGQTCVCSDYVCVHSDDKDEFVAACIKYIKQFFANEKGEYVDYAAMINSTKYDRVVSLLNDGEILFGGQTDASQNFISPTIMVPYSMDTPIMTQEIFGPILPIITYTSESELIATVRKNRYPLSLYTFADSSSFIKNIMDKIEFGGGCIHNTVYHLGNPNLPFGGIQRSGMGSYHGQTGFDTFSNTKSILKSAKWFDISLLYQPYTASKLKIIKQFFKL
jgi:aldehyde dehydrogenase (NAD+)